MSAHHKVSATPHTESRDHGGNLDAARAAFGGTREDWLDLSTGINPVAYPLGDVHITDWTSLPDQKAQAHLTDTARRFWHVPDDADILAAPGASALIARLPFLAKPGRVQITAPTYNEHAAAFRAAGWQVVSKAPAEARVLVHPNNPDGRVFGIHDIAAEMTVIDESFCDVTPEHSLVSQCGQPGVILLKSFGKFWGLAGLRLGFAIGTPQTLRRLSDMLGPWPVSGPALRIGAAALSDPSWADAARARLTRDRVRLDAIMRTAGARPVGGTSLFGLYHVADAQALQHRLAQSYVWTRIFPYSDTLIRLGLPAPDRWSQLERAV